MIEPGSFEASLQLPDTWGEEQEKISRKNVISKMEHFSRLDYTLEVERVIRVLVDECKIHGAHPNLEYFYDQPRGAEFNYVQLKEAMENLGYEGIPELNLDNDIKIKRGHSDAIMPTEEETEAEQIRFLQELGQSTPEEDKRLAHLETIYDKNLYAKGDSRFIKEENVKNNEESLDNTDVPQDADGNSPVIDQKETSTPSDESSQNEVSEGDESPEIEIPESEKTVKQKMEGKGIDDFTIEELKDLQRQQFKEEQANSEEVKSEDIEKEDEEEDEEDLEKSDEVNTESGQNTNGAPSNSEIPDNDASSFNKEEKEPEYSSKEEEDKESKNKAEKQQRQARPPQQQGVPQQQMNMGQMGMHHSGKLGETLTAYGSLAAKALLGSAVAFGAGTLNGAANLMIPARRQMKRDELANSKVEQIQNSREKIEDIHSKFKNGLNIDGEPATDSQKEIVKEKLESLLGHHMNRLSEGGEMSQRDKMSEESKDALKEEISKTEPLIKEIDESLEQDSSEKLANIRKMLKTIQSLLKNLLGKSSEKTADDDEPSMGM